MRTLGFRLALVRGVVLVVPVAMGRGGVATIDRTGIHALS
jgi:hypothetical protein